MDMNMIWFWKPPVFLFFFFLSLSLSLFLRRETHQKVVFSRKAYLCCLHRGGQRFGFGSIKRFSGDSNDSPLNMSMSNPSMKMILHCYVQFTRLWTENWLWSQEERDAFLKEAILKHQSKCDSRQGRVLVWGWKWCILNLVYNIIFLKFAYCT